MGIIICIIKVCGNGNIKLKHFSTFQYYVQNSTTMSLTDIITVLSFHSHNNQSQHQNRLWKETEIKQVIEYLTDKKTLCGKTNALINTYFANGEKDESMEHIGEQLMERYDYAEKYLTQLQSIIMQSIDKNKQAIKAEKKTRERTNQCSRKIHITFNKQNIHN